MPTTPLCFFIGTDSLQNLFTWQQWPTLFSLCHFVVCERQGESVKDLKGHSDSSSNQQADGSSIQQAEGSLKLQAEGSSKLQTLLNKRQIFNPMELHKSLAGHIYVANTQTLTVSSSEIRQQLANNQSVETFLPPKILDYIQQHKLYQPSTDFC
jgi:nicotinate-nucleotide adenylyltransferase